MAMQSLSNLDEEILVCPICLGTLKEPKILGCLHRYCKDCLSNVIENIPSAESFHCPTCRQEFEVPAGKVEGIKGDFLLEAVLERRKLERDLKDKQKQQICSSCNKHTTMVAICPDCGGFVCEVCQSFHKVMKIFSSHDHIVTLEDIENGKVNLNVKSITSTLKAPKCPVHKDMILHINCQTCDKLICPVCAPLHHNNHHLEEIASASERIKVKVGELVENSVKSEKILEEKMGEFRQISRAKLGEISGTYVQLKETADREEELIRNSEEEFLKWLERKKKMVQEETKEKIRCLRHEEFFLTKEIKMMENFCSQTSQKVEEQADAETKKMRNSQMTAQILMKDVDNWAVVLSASDVQNNLQVTSKANTVKEVEEAMGNLTEMTVDVHDLRVSSMRSICWKVKWTIELCKTDKTWVETGHPKTMCDMKFIQEINKLVLAGRSGNNIEVLAVEMGIQTVSWQYGYVWEANPSPKYISVAGILNKSIYSTSICTGLEHSRLTKKEGNAFRSSTLLYNKGKDAVVSCVAQYHNNATLVVGLCRSTVLHVCDFDANCLSSVEVKVVGLSSPVSLATTEKNNILLCDGVRNAIAVSFEGTLICTFSGRNPTDRPVVISVDRNGFVYVLWKVNEEKVGELSYQVDKKENEGKKAAANNGTNTKPTTSIVMQYTPSATFISEFVVNSDVTMMTTIVTDDDEDAVAVCTPDGLIQCYRMTSFGRTWQNFIQQQSIESDSVQQPSVE